MQEVINKQIDKVEKEIQHLFGFVQIVILFSTESLRLIFIKQNNIVYYTFHYDVLYCSVHQPKTTYVILGFRTYLMKKSFSKCLF